jgi:four helix bundle protein
MEVNMTLEFQRLAVYTKALEFVAVVTEVLEAMPRGFSFLAKQLDKAACSAPANIAEGAGEYRPKEKARFYRIAKRSVTESVAHLDVMRIKRIVSDQHYNRCLAIAPELLSMLTSLCRRFDRDE